MFFSVFYPQMKFRYSELVILMFLLLSGCSVSDENSESVAWLRIDTPPDGFTTTLDHVTVSGNAAIRDASQYPYGDVYWHNNGNSGIVYSQVQCLFACLIAFQDSIPLSLGENNIRLEYMDGSDTVTVTRLPMISLEGKITDQAMAGVPGVKVELKDVVTSSVVAWVRTDSLGDYQFPYTTPGDYQITPVLSEPQWSGCLGFTPDSIGMNVSFTSNNISGLDFSSIQLATCYSVSGVITPAPPPDDPIMLILEDSIGNEYWYWTYDGSYTFYHLPPGGSYTITPVQAFANFIPSYRNITIIDSDITGQDFSW